MIDKTYKAQVNLLLQVLPFVAKEDCFALKGGTAINLFERELPRLSIDIDLTYLPVEDRRTTLSNISKSLGRIKLDIESHVDGVSVSTTKREGQDAKINCQSNEAQIKIEVNTVTRGHIYPTRKMIVTEKAEEEFEKFAEINVVSHAELFGGKICAALDRQHPRDLFDVKILLEEEGLTDEVKNGFLVALLSHMRPINEVLIPHFVDNREAYDNQFSGMTDMAFSYKDYEDTRVRLTQTIKTVLKPEDKEFLLSFKAGKPDWTLFPVTIVKELPAVRWKLQNIERLRRENTKKFHESFETLEKKLQEF
jgi:predicted nucleotidyltransferase component of viral defense system